MAQGGRAAEFKCQGRSRRKEFTRDVIWIVPQVGRQLRCRATQLGFDRREARGRMRGGAAMATSRAALQRCARVRGGAAFHHSARAVPAAGVADFAGHPEPEPLRAPQDDARRRASIARSMAASAFSLSFAASTMSVAFAKERVADKFAPHEVVLYQYDACPFCNKVKGSFFGFRIFELLKRSVDLALHEL